MQEKYDGELHIGLVHSSREDDYISITLNDSTSRTRVADIKLSITDFANAAVGHRAVNCQFTANDSRVGWKAEHKTEIVNFECNSSHQDTRQNAAQKALDPWESDGWKGRLEDLFNHHRKISNTNQYRVSFDRFVK